MTRAGKTMLIARAEVIKHLHRPAFWLGLFLLPLIAGIILAVSSSANDEDDQVLPGLTGPIAAELEPGKAQIGFVELSGLVPGIPASFPAETAGLYRRYPDEPAALQALQAEQIPAFYVIPANYLAHGELRRVSPQLSPFGSVLQERLIELLLTTSLLDSQDVGYASLLMRPAVALRIAKIDAPRGNDLTEQERMSAAFSLGTTFAIMLYAAIFSATNLLLQSLIEEKENRVIEVMLSSVSPQALLAGKTLGLGLLGLVQMLVWLGLGALVFNRGGSVIESLANIDVAPGVWALALICFLLGYLIYASLMAGIGAITNTMREASQLVMAISVPIMLPMIFLSVIITQPDGALAQVLSFVPFTAPVVLVVRSVISAVPVWEIGLALAGMLLTVFVLQRGAARMFRASTLLAGTRPTLGTVLRALRS